MPVSRCACHPDPGTFATFARAGLRLATTDANGANAVRAPQRSEELPERNQPTSAGGAPRGWQRRVCVATANPANDAGHGTSAHPADGHQLAAVGGHGQHQRPHRVATPALALGPADHHHLEGLEALDLAPRGGPAPREVATVEELGHHPLEVERLRHRPRLVGIAHDHGRHLEAPTGSPAVPPDPVALALALAVAARTRFGELERLEEPTALAPGEVDQREPVEVEEVEHQVGDRHRGHEPGIGPGHVHALLQPGERRPAVDVGGHDLAVHHHPSVSETGAEVAEPERPGQVGERRGDVASRAGGQPPATRTGLGHGAHAVPLHLERPVRRLAGAGQRARGGQHGAGERAGVAGHPHRSTRWPAAARLRARPARGDAAGAGDELG
jgi:hypothetical protein